MTIDARRSFLHWPCVIGQENPLLLGSASPRRRDILQGLGIPIRVVAADVVEDVIAEEAPLAYLERVVADKLQAVLARTRGQRFGALLVADTTVVVDQKILGKPADRQEAEALLAQLVGRRHRVYTRYAIADSAGRALQERTVASDVLMRAASSDEVARYAATGEGLDKAGAYAVQGIGAFLIERIEGSYSNVVGLPACELVADLLSLGLLPHFP